jgi:hypothetical protein
MLRAQLAVGALRVCKAVDYAAQMAHGLAAAILDPGGIPTYLCSSSNAPSGTARCMGTCLSRSGTFFPYMLRTADDSMAAEIYAVFDATVKPLKVAEGPYSPTHLVAWVGY